MQRWSLQHLLSESFNLQWTWYSRGENKSVWWFENEKGKERGKQWSEKEKEREKRRRKARHMRE